MKSISILTPIYNNDKTLDLFFSQINKQIIPDDCSKIEFLICNDGSNELTTNLINKYSGILDNKFSVHIFHNIKNIGWRRSLDNLYENSTGDILVFIDSDAIPVHENWLKELTRNLFNDSADVIQGDFWSQLEDNFWSRQHSKWRKSIYMSRFVNEDGTLNTVNTRNLAINRMVINEIKSKFGHFLDSKATSAGADTKLGFEIRKLEKKIYLLPTAKIKHGDPLDYLGIIKQKIKHGYFDGKIGIYYKNNFYNSVYIPYKKERVSFIFSIPITIGFWFANIFGYLKYVRDTQASI